MRQGTGNTARRSPATSLSQYLAAMGWESLGAVSVVPRQPHRLHGLCDVQVDLHAHGLPILKRPYVGDIAFHDDPAALTTGTDSQEGYDLVARLDESFWVVLQVIERLGKGGHRIAHAFRPAARFRAGLFGWLHDLELSAKAFRPQLTAVERLVSAPHSFHILLRHRLVRQPYGFEGFFARWVKVHPNGPPASHCPDHREPLVDLDLAQLASPGVMDHCDDAVTCVEHLLELEVFGLEALLPCFDKTGELQGPGVYDAVGQIGSGQIPNDLRVDQIDVFREAALVVDVDQLPNDLDVLLRHRLLREAGGFEGLGPRAEGGPPDGLAAPKPGHLPDRALDD